MRCGRVGLVVTVGMCSVVRGRLGIAVEAVRGSCATTWACDGGHHALRGAWEGAIREWDGGTPRRWRDVPAGQLGADMLLRSWWRVSVPGWTACRSLFLPVRRVVVVEVKWRISLNPPSPPPPPPPPLGVLPAASPRRLGSYYLDFLLRGMSCDSGGCCNLTQVLSKPNL